MIVESVGKFIVRTIRRKHPFRSVSQNAYSDNRIDINSLEIISGHRMPWERAFIVTPSDVTVYSPDTKIITKAKRMATRMRIIRVRDNSRAIYKTIGKLKINPVTLHYEDPKFFEQLDEMI